MNNLLTKTKKIGVAIFILMGYFWTFAPLGLMIFGMGPALLVMTFLFKENGWEINFKKNTMLLAFQTFKSYFKMGNTLFFAYISIITLFIFAYNQIHILNNIVAAIVTLFIFFVITTCTVVFILALYFGTENEFKVLDVLVKSWRLISVNLNFMIRISLISSVLIFLIYKNINLLFFGLIEIMIIINVILTQKASNQIHENELKNYF